jgi:alpha-glucosidase (family GH31 glycosyl hydrolase)
MRYAQWALLNPSPVTSGGPEIDDTRFPWSHSPQVEAIFAPTRTAYRLLPYFTALGWQAYQTGLPLLRPLLLEFCADGVDDPHLAGIDDQVMLRSA